ncbi:proteasome accessory factor PafA2 family protein [Bifidobacterium sp. ESL0745]|uniref:proteasome accessory factor PafA2 family protein n=1 Tax=Bifidobacterium sp. ESL0745 TaxID=2983226 RepID=UPI0023F787CF|nr:proteasome accessory factor PafA2 family protein [Bifidobacterium sp. ESL0745]MDF7664902.1 proteasome accessory factor PafA2 family protein [Bifidobacterium sp. ESL0745]
MPQLRDSSNQGPGNTTSRSPEYDSFHRIFGIETEYGVSVTRANHPCDPGQVAMMMFAPILSRSRSTNTYLENGSRLYLDVGSHPEYATAEARDPAEALVQDLAGEQIMRRLAIGAQERLRKTHGEHATIHLFKDNVDSAGHAFGCHENYLVRRYVSLPIIKAQLLPFLVTRQLFTGSGRVSESGFEITQRAAFLDEGVSSSTTRFRPMVNTRDEPHADPDEFRRLHVIIGDSNRSQWATKMKLATTHLVLCVMEDAAKRGAASGFECCALSDPSASNKAMSADLSCAKTVIGLEDIAAFRRTQREFGLQSPDSDADASTDSKADSQAVTALEIQYLYWTVVSRFVESHRVQIESSLPDTNCTTILREWKTALDALSAKDFDGLSNRVDWVAKYQLLGKMKERNPSLSPAQARQIDMNYHDIVNGSIYPLLVGHGLMETLVSDGAVEYAVKNPPHDTRAALRGGFVHRALQSGATFSCDWTHLKTTAPTHHEAVLIDPFAFMPDDRYRLLVASL